MSAHLKDFIVVEEDDTHFDSFKIALDQLNISGRPFRVQNADELLNLLDSPDSAGISHFKPRLVFFGMPLLSGRVWEFLEMRRNRAELRKIPLVVMTDSAMDYSEKQKLYDFGVNSLVMRPESQPEFNQLIEAMGRYWFGIVMLPSSE